MLGRPHVEKREEKGRGKGEEGERLVVTIHDTGHRKVGEPTMSRDPDPD